MRRRLIVYVPAFGQTTKSWEPLLRRLRQETLTTTNEEPLEVTWRSWDHHCRILTPGNAAIYAVSLRADIDQAWSAQEPDGPYDEIVLLGHSFGGVLVRAAYLLAAGATPGAVPSSWHDRVIRIVLFAAPNRGIDPRRPQSKSLTVRLLRMLGFATRPGQTLFRGLTALFVVADILEGSDFMTELRLDWIRHFRATANERLPDVVQLRGTADDLVAPTDSVDLAQFPKCHYFDVNGATHANLHLPETDSDHPEERYRYLRRAIVGPLTTPAPEQPTDSTARVVFILHGIRANNRTWVHQAAELVSTYPNTTPVVSTYGWFSMLRFFLPWIRRRNIPWLQNEYSEALARKPAATFYFLGHSNGTYILGQSLLRLRGMRFERIALAGSVLPADYSWGDRVTTGQVRELHNHCANRDVPVGIICSALRGLRMRDIGSAGVLGFNVDIPQKREFAYYPGGHSAALVPDRLQQVVRLLMTGAHEDVPKDLVTDTPRWFDRLSRAAPWLAVPLAFLLGTGIVTLTIWLASMMPSWLAVIGVGLLLFVVLVLLAVM